MEGISAEEGGWVELPTTGIEVEDRVMLEKDRTWPPNEGLAGVGFDEGQPATATKLCHRTLAVAMRVGVGLRGRMTGRSSGANAV